MGAKLSRLYYGAAYYPEWYDRANWEQDARYMKEAGLNVVRIGEFAWADMEPEEGRIDLSLFREAMDFYHEQGLKVILCTPTATPPIWLSHGHPERMVHEADGVPMSHGSRQHVCINNAYFRERARIIGRAMAEALGRHPALLAWQIDNELKGHVAECFCPTCRALWPQWLAARYGTIERLNEAWGTVIWSERYASFEQVPAPVKTPYLHNASLSTAYRLFTRETASAFVREQAALLREHSDAPITHNTGLSHYVDNETLFEPLDFAGFDQYGDEQQFRKMALAYDIFRAMKRGAPYWVMETAPSFSANTQGYHKLLPDGYVPALASAAYASGAEGFMYWVWRQPHAGVEHPHGSAISAWGTPTVGYRPVVEAGAAKAELEAALLATTPAQAEVAITYSDRARAFLLTEPSEGLVYLDEVSRFHRAAADAGLYRDMPPEGAALDGYKLLITPYVMHLSEAYIERAMAFVRGGGVWVVGPLTGIRTADHAVHRDAALGRLESLAGVRTVFHAPLTGSGATGSAFGEKAPLSLWSCVFEATDADVLGVVEGGPADGLAFLTERRVGRGKVAMLGSMPAGEAGAAMLERIVRRFADEAGVTQRTDATPGTYVYPREAAGERLWIAVNLDGVGGSVTLPADGVDAVTGARVAAGPLAVPPYGRRAVRLPQSR